MDGGMVEGCSIPLYQQVANRLRELIEKDVYHVGAKIPTEPELGCLYGVSRITVRKAVASLVDEGLLVKRQGKGTFVQGSHTEPIVHDDRHAALVGFSESCRKNGLVPGSEVISREVVEIDGEERAFFDGASKVLLIERLCTADGSPIMIDHCLFSLDGFEYLKREELNNHSLFDVIYERSGRRPQRGGPQTLGIALADERRARILSVPIGEPLFLLSGHYCDQDGGPLYIGRQHIIGSRYTFSM